MNDFLVIASIKYITPGRFHDTHVRRWHKFWTIHQSHQTHNQFGLFNLPWLHVYLDRRMKSGLHGDEENMQTRHRKLWGRPEIRTQNLELLAVSAEPLSHLSDLSLVF